MENRRAQIRDDASGVEPENVLVLETVGSVGEFWKALKGLDGLEWLCEFDVENLSPDSDFHYEQDAERDLGGRLYWIMFNQTGLNQLQRLWATYKENLDDPDAKPQFDRGYTKWRDLFAQLRTIRTWGPEDRVDGTGLLEDWTDQNARGLERTNVEIELWWRNNPSTREQAVNQIVTEVERADGTVLRRVTISEIQYTALLAELPTEAVGRISRLESIQLLRADAVMYFRPTGQVVAPVEEPDPEPLGEVEGDVALPSGSPRVALLDSVPLENHPLLAGRLIVDDPDEWAALAPSHQRLHGTAMASLICLGDLEAEEDPLRRPVYVRPIMRPNPLDFVNASPDESVPDDELTVDLVHRAVRRIIHGEGQESASAPSVKIINLSIGDRMRIRERSCFSG